MDDWICSLCSFKNFARLFCLKCKKRKSHQHGAELGEYMAKKSQGLFNKDDWMCGSCFNVNWARRSYCHLCKTPKSGIIRSTSGDQDEEEHHPNKKDRKRRRSSSEDNTSKRKKCKLGQETQKTDIRDTICSSKRQINQKSHNNYKSYPNDQQQAQSSKENRSAGPNNENSENSSSHKERRLRRYKFWIDQGIEEERAEAWSEHPLEEFLVYHELVAAGKVKPFNDSTSTSTTTECESVKSPELSKDDSLLRQEHDIVPSYVYDTELPHEGTSQNGDKEFCDFTQDISFEERSFCSANEQIQDPEISRTSGQHPGTQEEPWTEALKSRRWKQRSIDYFKRKSNLERADSMKTSTQTTADLTCKLLGTSECLGEWSEELQSKTTESKDVKDLTAVASTSSDTDNPWGVHKPPSGAEKRRRKKLRAQLAALQGEGGTNTPTNGAKADFSCKSNLEAADSKRTSADLNCMSSLEEADLKTTSTQRLRSFKKALSLNLVVIAKDYPATCLERDHIRLLQKLTADSLRHSPDPLPIFVIEPVTFEGSIKVTCSNQSTAQWFYNIMSGKTLGEVKVMVVDEDELPKGVKMVYRSVNMALDDNAEALQYLQRYNPSLKTSEWRVISTEVEDTQICRIVLMDRISADVIADAGYTLPTLCEYAKFELLEDLKKTGEDSINVKQEEETLWSGQGLSMENEVSSSGPWLSTATSMSSLAASEDSEVSIKEELIEAPQGLIND